MHEPVAPVRLLLSEDIKEPKPKMNVVAGMTVFLLVWTKVLVWTRASERAPRRPTFVTDLRNVQVFERFSAIPVSAGSHAG